MDDRLFAFEVGLFNGLSVSHTAGDFHHRRNARCVGVGAFVEGRGTVHRKGYDRQNRYKAENNEDHIEDEGGGTRSHCGNGANEPQYGKGDDCRRGSFHQEGVGAHKAGRQLVAHLITVVVRHDDDLARAGPALAHRLVARDHVLTDAAREQAGQHRLVEDLAQVEGAAHGGNREREHRDLRSQHADDGEQDGEAEADRLNDTGLRVAREFFDFGFQARRRAKAFRDVFARLLLLFRSRRSRAYFLRKIPDIVSHVGHACAFQCVVTDPSGTSSKLYAT